MLLVLVALTLVAVVPPLLEVLQLGVAGTVIVQVRRWGLLIAVVVIALAVVYRSLPTVAARPPNCAVVVTNSPC